MKKARIILVVGIFSFLTWAGVRTYKQCIVFDLQCQAHLERMAHAGTLEVATSELETAVKFLEDRGLTSGNTGLIIKSPATDVGYWYNNLRTTLNEIKSVPSSASPLEKSNVLIKLRETVMRKGDVIVPDAIAIAPHNWTFAIWGTGSLLMILFGVIFGTDLHKVAKKILDD